jgi:hypothetical protein
MRALILLERFVPPDPPTLASLLNNIVTIQISIGLYYGALLNFIRVLCICERVLAEEHPTRLVVENNIRRIQQSSYSAMLNISESVPPPEPVPSNSGNSIVIQYKRPTRH